MSDTRPESEERCIWLGCVATWRHWHWAFPGGYDNPADPEGLPIPFTGDDPDPDAVRDYNGAALPTYMCPNCVTPWKCNGPHIPEPQP